MRPDWSSSCRRSSAPISGARCRTPCRAAVMDRFRPHTEMLKKANEPLLLVRQLRKLGGLTLEVDSSRLPSLNALEPESAYLSWTFTLATGAPKSAIHEVFEFVEDDCEIKIDAIDAPAVPVEASGSET